MTNKPSAPAPEPVAWEDVNCPGDFYTKKISGMNLRPLYAHPAPVAAPDADAIMTRAVLFKHAKGLTEDNATYDALRAAIEQIVRERDEARKDGDLAVDRQLETFQKLLTAERERDELKQGPYVGIAYYQAEVKRADEALELLREDRKDFDDITSGEVGINLCHKIARKALARIDALLKGTK